LAQPPEMWRTNVNFSAHLQRWIFGLQAFSPTSIAEAFLFL
jgi:hypothetical protein